MGNIKPHQNWVFLKFLSKKDLLSCKDHLPSNSEPSWPYDIEEILAMASQPQLRWSRRNKIMELLRTKIEKNKKIIEQLEQAQQQLGGGGGGANGNN